MNFFKKKKHDEPAPAASTTSPPPSSSASAPTSLSPSSTVAKNNIQRGSSVSGITIPPRINSTAQSTQGQQAPPPPQQPPQQQQVPQLQVPTLSNTVPVSGPSNGLDQQYYLAQQQQQQQQQYPYQQPYQPTQQQIPQQYLQPQQQPQSQQPYQQHRQRDSDSISVNSAMIAQQQLQQQQQMQQMQQTLQQMQLQQQQQQQQMQQQQQPPQVLQGSYGETSLLSQTLVYDPSMGMGGDASGYNNMGNINMNNNTNTNGYSPENPNNNISYPNQNYSADQMYNSNQGYGGNGGGNDNYNQSPNYGNNQNQNYVQGYDNQQGYDGNQQSYDGQQSYDQQQQQQNFGNNSGQNGYGGGDGYGQSQGQGQGQEGFYSQNNNNLYNMNSNDNNNNNIINNNNNNIINNNNQNNQNNNQNINQFSNGNISNGNNLTSSALHLPGQGNGHLGGGGQSTSEDPSLNNGNNSGNLNMNGSQSNASVESLPLDVRKLQDEIISWKKSHDVAQQKLNQLRQTLTQKSQENREIHNSLTQVTQDRLMLQELVHKREKEIDDLRSQYLNDVRQIRATDDDHSTIEQRIRMLNASILQLTKSSAGDRSVNMNVDAVHSLVKKKYLFGNTQPYLLNMFLEKYIMDSLLEEVFNKPFYVGFSLAKEVGLIHSWMNENSFGDQAVRFRQQLCYLSAKCPATQSHAAEEAARIAKVFEAKLEKLYNNWCGQAKVLDLVTRAIELSLTMRSQGSEIAAKVFTNEVEFDPEKMVAAHKSKEGGKVRVCVLPCFIDTNGAVVGKAKVFCG